MLASLLVYCYATGRFSSRAIEEATHSDVAVRFITGDTHPDHDTICSFRRNNVGAFRDLFVKVLAVAGQSGLIKKVGGISVDGTKIKANASKHSAVSYQRAGKLIEQLRLEVDMKAGSGQHFEQSYNAQAAVDTEGSMMILGCRVTCNPNDKQELQPTVDSVDGDVREISHVLADTGYMSERQIEAVEADKGPTAYVATKGGRHGRTVADLERRPDPPPPPAGAPTVEVMKHRMQTREGRQRYRLRKQTVEPVFGIIKHVMGFRQFHLRGHPKADLEWCVVCLGYNIRRLFRLSGSGALLENAAIGTLGG